jgi:hypothetical protein
MVDLRVRTLYRAPFRPSELNAPCRDEVEVTQNVFEKAEAMAEIL